MKYLVLVLALLIPQMAAARIGETKEQCAKRYGQPIVAHGDKLFYEAGGYNIIASFFDSRCVQVAYGKAKEDGVDPRMDKAVIEGLLAKTGEKFTKAGENTTREVWLSNSLLAFYCKTGHMLHITDKAWIRPNKEEKKRDGKGGRRPLTITVQSPEMLAPKVHAQQQQAHPF